MSKQRNDSPSVDDAALRPLTAAGLVMAWTLGLNSAATNVPELQRELKARRDALRDRRGQYSDLGNYIVARYRLLIIDAASCESFEELEQRDSLPDREHLRFQAWHVAQAELLRRADILGPVAQCLDSRPGLVQARRVAERVRPLRNAGVRLNCHVAGIGRGPVSKRVVSELAKDPLGPCICCGDRHCHVHCRRVRGGAHRPDTDGTCKRCGEPADLMLGEPVWWRSDTGLDGWICKRPVEESPDLLTLLGL